jgi:hypothetical protein
MPCWAKMRVVLVAAGAVRLGALAYLGYSAAGDRSSAMPCSRVFTGV